MKINLLNILCGVGVFFGALFLVGIASILWSGYNDSRSPVFQSVSREFEFCERSNFGIMEQVEKLGVKEIHAFVFKAHSNRPFYEFIAVGKCKENAPFPKGENSSLLKDRVSVMTALKLSGVVPGGDEKFEEIFPFLYRYKDRIIYYECFVNKTFISEKTDMKAVLEPFIRFRKRLYAAQ